MYANNISEPCRLWSRSRFTEQAAFTRTLDSQDKMVLSLMLFVFHKTTEGHTDDFLSRFGNIKSTTRSASTDCHIGFDESQCGVTLRRGFM
jgi:hypothetical protein